MRRDVATSTEVEVDYDPIKDAANLAKHGVSLARAVDMIVAAVVEDPRYEERRFRLYGEIDGVAYCLAATLRGRTVRAISLRRAHRKEYRRYV